jgi:glycosyltransferase involved in cell wall biosynthesis
VLNHITPLILTYNEAPNVARTLSKLAWAREVVIVDSGSTDRTREAAHAAHAGVRWFERAFTTHAEQWNFGLTATGITTDWVLALDADFVLTNALVDELRQLAPDATTSGYQASFDYCIEGQPLRGAAYPPVVVLFRRSQAAYEQDGHTQRVRVSGAISRLASKILHDDRKPLSHWLGSQIRYMRLEAEKLTTTPAAELTFADRIRRQIVIAAPAMFVYCLIGKGGILDGWRGVYYAVQRACAELILSLFLLDRRVVRGRDAADR